VMRPLGTAWTIPGAGILAVSAMSSRPLRRGYVQYIRPGCLRVLWDNPLNDKK
jgi:hypothetical protein